MSYVKAYLYVIMKYNDLIRVNGSSLLLLYPI